MMSRKELSIKEFPKRTDKNGNIPDETLFDRIKSRLEDFDSRSIKEIALIIVFLLCSVFVSALPNKCFGESAETDDLDLIESYRVDVSPRSDGSLDIYYDIRWRVLDGDTQGPLTWVKLGLGNSSCDITGWSGDVKNCSVDGTYARVDLFGSYSSGQTANIRLNVNQKDMLCKNEKEPERPFYRFTPGWFDNIDIQSYRFTWQNSVGVISNNSDAEENGLLIWRGEMKKGERRTMELAYDIGYFNTPQLVTYKDYSAASGAPSGTKEPPAKSMLSMFFMLLIVGVLFIRRERNGGYNNGRGFGRAHGHYYGGSHRGCACAGCACACACAGGGRAGCSVKDYYDPKRDG